MDIYLNTAISAVEAAGKVLLANFNKPHDLKNKTENFRDIVTEVDFLSENIITNIILSEYPDHSIIAEESGKKINNPRYKWYIDPLDGTINYLSGISMCVISVALVIDDEVKVGVIYNPFLEQKYYATKGGGAYLNNKVINVSDRENFNESLFVAAFPNKSSKLVTKSYSLFGEVNNSTKGVLRLGSVALALAYLSEGLIDGVWGVNIKDWDYMAGAILVQEAGGKFTIVNKGYNDSEKLLIFSTPGIFDQLLDTCNNFLQ